MDSMCKVNFIFTSCDNSVEYCCLKHLAFLYCHLFHLLFLKIVCICCTVCSRLVFHYEYSEIKSMLKTAYLPYHLWYYCSMHYAYCAQYPHCVVYHIPQCNAPSISHFIHTKISILCIVYYILYTGNVLQAD